MNLLSQDVLSLEPTLWAGVEDLFDYARSNPRTSSAQRVAYAIPGSLLSNSRFTAEEGEGWASLEKLRLSGAVRPIPIGTGFEIETGSAGPHPRQASRVRPLSVFPSWQEGWGLPVTEALRLGVPVLCSSAGALSEAGGTLARRDPCPLPADALVRDREGSDGSGLVPGILGGDHGDECMRQWP